MLLNLNFSYDELVVLVSALLMLKMDFIDWDEQDSPEYHVTLLLLNDLEDKLLEWDGK